jgi:DNA primase
MAEEWLTYNELAERLGVSSEAARQKAIRHRWPRRTANDGKAQVRVDVEDVRATLPVRKPKDEPPSNGSPTPDDSPSDTRALAALEAHIETLKAMAAKAEGIAELERQRADTERGRADSERERANRLASRVDELLTEASKATERDRQAADLEEQVKQLRGMVEAAARRPWWKRLAG